MKTDSARPIVFTNLLDNIEVSLFICKCFKSSSFVSVSAIVVPSLSQDLKKTGKLVVNSIDIKV